VINRTFRPSIEWTAALVLAVGLAWLTFRAGRLLTFDGYHYCELTKQFALEWPDRFGNHWPFGWPLAGAILSRLGLPAFESLVALGVLSLALILAGANRVLATSPARPAVLFALGATPIVAPQIGSVLTELPFATALLGLALCLTAWPARGAIWGAILCAVLALSIRYAGLICLAALATWTLTRWTSLRSAGRSTEAVVATLVASLTSAGLLALNVLKSGHLSGAGRGDAPGISALPAQMADFGWSLPSALIAGGLRDRIGPYTQIGVAIGAVCFAVIAALCVLAWFRPSSAFSRPLALISLGYCTGMAVLRCVGEFDALHVARTFLPALPPLLLLLAEQLGNYRRTLIAICVVLLATGVIAAARGISREIGGNIHPVLAPLSGRVTPADRVAINDHAFAISAYLPNRTLRVWTHSHGAIANARFLIVAAKPRSRDGSGATLPSDWLNLCAELVASGRFTYLVHMPDVIALEQMPSPPQVLP